METSAPLASMAWMSAGTGAWVQAPATGLQPSVVQASPSSQEGGAPARQPVALQVSAPLQKSPSSQAAATGAWAQAPVPGLQVSLVQETPSSQEGGAPGWQPSEGSQVSAPLQKLPSSQAPAAQA
jgi:hypothetical protein